MRSTSDRTAARPAPHAASLQRNQSLVRAVRVLRALAAQDGPARASDVARAAELPLPTTRRLLATLHDEGLAEVRRDDGRWTVGYDLVRLVRAADPYAALATRALPALERLVAEVGETAMLAAARLPAGIEVVAQVDAPRTIRIASWVGRSFPLHASVGARVALAALDDDAIARLLGPAPYPRLARATRTTLDEVLRAVRATRANGVAEGADELEDGLATVAIPVGEPSADGIALALYAPTSRLDTKARRAVIPALRHAAEEVRVAVER